MRIFTILSLTGLCALLSLTSLQQKQIENKEYSIDWQKNNAQIDSVHSSVVYNLIYRQLLSRLIGKGGIESSWSMVDKTGHRDLIITNASVNWQNQENNWIQLASDNVAYGDLVRVDGTLQRHICSFKIVFPQQRIYARRSALDKWQTIKQFTGVRKNPTLRKSTF